MLTFKKQKSAHMTLLMAKVRLHHKTQFETIATALKSLYFHVRRGLAL